MAKDTGFDFDTPVPRQGPQSVDEALDWLQLIRTPRVGPVTFGRLLTEYGTARAALEALPQVAAKAGLKNHRPAERSRVEREYAAGRKGGARLVALGGPLYSPMLARIDDPPPLLWCRGNIDLLKGSSVAVVGARNASALGQRLARAVCKGLGQAEQIVVSGLARGIDAAAHEAALPTGTIAVVAGGVDVVYPKENAALTSEIAEKGLIVSDQPIGMQPQARHFPRRNRIIAGLSRAVVVVEAATKSGSLLTAQDAADQGREVMAIPGHPFDGRATGCNQLLRDGATLVRSADDILQALSPPPAPEDDPEVIEDAPGTIATISASELNARILAQLSATPIAEDMLIRALELPAAQVTAALTELEMLRRITRAPGGLLSLGDG